MMLPPTQQASTTLVTSMVQSIVDDIEKRRIEEEEKASGKKEDKVVKAQVRSDDVSKAANARINEHFFGALKRDENPMATLIARFTSAVGIAQETGESNDDFATRLTDSLVFVQMISNDAVSGKTAESVSLARFGVSGAAPRLLFVVADAANRVAETDRTDNTAFREIAVLPLADLAVSGAGIVLTPAQPRPDEATAIAVTVQNLGGQEAVAVKVRLFDGTTALGERTLAALAPKEETAGETAVAIPTPRPSRSTDPETLANRQGGFVPTPLETDELAAAAPRIVGEADQSASATPGQPPRIPGYKLPEMRDFRELLKADILPAPRS